MKLMINIPEYVIDDMKECGFIPEEDNEELCKAIDNGTPIPDNATNGDVIKAMFPYYSYERNDYVQSTEDYIIDSMECMEHDLYFGFDWWNAPYQKGGTSENNI